MRQGPSFETPAEGDFKIVETLETVPDVEELDSEKIREEIRTVLAGTKGIQEVRDFTLTCVENRIDIAADITADIVGAFGLTATIKNEKGKLDVRDIKIEAKLAKGVMISAFIKVNLSELVPKIEEHLKKKYGKEVQGLSIENGKLKVRFPDKQEKVQKKVPIEKPVPKPQEPVPPSPVEPPPPPVPDVVEAPEMIEVPAATQELVEQLSDVVTPVIPEAVPVPAQEADEPATDLLAPITAEATPALDVVPAAEALPDALVTAPAEETGGEVAQENPFAREGVLFKKSFDKRGVELDETKEWVRNVRASVETGDMVEGKEKTKALEYLDKLDGVVRYLSNLRQNQKCSNKESMKALRAFKYLNQVGLIELPQAEHEPVDEVLSDGDFLRRLEEATRIVVESEKTKIYDDPYEDPAVWDVQDQIRTLANKLTEDARAKGKDVETLSFVSWATQQANFERWNVFASLYPEKAAAYKDKINMLPKALERMNSSKEKLVAIPEVVIPPVPVEVLRTLPPIRDAWSTAPAPVEPPTPAPVETPTPAITKREPEIVVPAPAPVEPPAPVPVETPEPVVVVTPETPKRAERKEKKETKESAEKPSVWRKVASIGLLVQHKKNAALSSAFGWYGKKLERELRATQIEVREQSEEARVQEEGGYTKMAQKLRDQAHDAAETAETIEARSQSTIARVLTGFAKGYEKSAQASEKQRQAFLNKEGVKASMAGWGALAQNSILMTRAVGRSLGGMSRVPAIVAMVANRSFDAFKEARLAKYDVINKTRVNDAERAYEEAEQIYKISQRMVGEGNKVTAKDLAKAYAEQLPKDLIRRFERGDSEKQPSYLGKLVASVGVRGVAERLQKKFEAIENNTKLNDEQKKLARAKEIQKNESLLRDLDRMVSDAGVVDMTASVMRDFGQASKKAAAAVALETLAEAGFNFMMPHDESVMAGVEGGVSSKVPEVTPQSMVKRISEGQDIMSNENVGHIDDLKHGPLLSETNVVSADTVIPTEPYTVKSGDKLWKLLADDLRERKIFNGISAEGQRDYVIDALKDKIAAMSDGERKLLGISSGNINKLTVGDTLDFNKLFDQDVVGGALKNAKLLSAEEIAAIESYKPPKIEKFMDTSDLDDPMALKEFLETHQSASEIRSDLGETIEVGPRAGDSIEGEPIHEETLRNEEWRTRRPSAEEIGESTPEESPRNEAWRERRHDVSEVPVTETPDALDNTVSEKIHTVLEKTITDGDNPTAEWGRVRYMKAYKLLQNEYAPDSNEGRLQAVVADLAEKTGMPPRHGFLMFGGESNEEFLRSRMTAIEQQSRAA